MEGFDFIDGKRTLWSKQTHTYCLSLIGNSGETSQTMPNFGGPPMNMEMGFDSEDAGKGFQPVSNAGWGFHGASPNG